jgi:hypothetical protein
MADEHYLIAESFHAPAFNLVASSANQTQKPRTLSVWKYSQTPSNEHQDMINNGVDGD